MKNIITKIFIFLIIFIISCKKENDLEVVENKSSCTPLNYDDKNAIDLIYINKNQFKSPYFNPNNPSEFVYYFRGFESNKHQLIVYDLSTKQSKVITDGLISMSQPKWSVKGWIAFDNYLDYQIWKVREDGSYLTILTNKNVNVWPVWDANGDYLMWKKSLVLAGPGYTLKSDLHQTIPDTIHYGGMGFNHDNISVDNRYFHVRREEDNTRTIGYYDLKKSEMLISENYNKIMDVYPHIDEQNGFLSVTWGRVDKKEKIYFTGFADGLFEIDVLNKTVRRLIESCNSRYYKNISCSPDGKYLIAERLDGYIEKETGRHFENSTIWLIDLNTLEETKVEL